MDKFIIAGKFEAQDISARYPGYYHFLSISGPEEGELAKIGPDDKVCRLWFSDIVYTNPALEEKGCILPTTNEVVKGILFAHEHTNEPLVVHCYAGISRSPAMAILIQFDRSGDMQQTVRDLYKKNPYSCPNKLILKLGLQYLKPQHWNHYFQCYKQTEEDVLKHSAD